MPTTVKTILLYLLGLFSGVVLMVGIQYYGAFTSVASQAVTGPVGGGFYMGYLPDFSVEPVSGVVYEYIEPDWSLASPGKEDLPFHSFKGKVVFLNLWATWCAPCIEEMPDIAAMQASLDTEDVAVLLVSNEQERIVSAFDNEHNLPLYVSRGAMPPALSGRGLPSTLIIDKKGVIRYKHAGPARWNDPSVLVYLNALAGEE